MSMHGATCAPTPLRSLLFVPGDRADRFDKAAASGAHAVLLDLEDAVAAQGKASARHAVADWIVRQADTYRPGAARPVVRINGICTDWHAEDLRMIGQLPSCVGVMLPKSEPAALACVAARLDSVRPLYALVETVDGVLGLSAMAQVPGLHRFAFGNIDFGVDAGITPGEDEMELAAVRTAFVLASRGARLPAPVDGVGLETLDPVRMEADAARARRFGFGGKLCIHPRQVAAVNAAFRPSAADQAWARGALAAFEASGGAVVAHAGQMVDRPVAERARRLLADAQAALPDSSHS